MLYENDEKIQKSKPRSKPAETAQNAANSAVSSSQQPAWTRVMGDHPPASLQAKLTVSQPGDAYEQEADRVASHVIGMSAPELLPGSTQPAQDESLMRKEGANASESGASQSVHPIIGSMIGSGDGQPLDTATRAFMEPRFGQDFSNVRVHEGELASAATELLGARAFAHGSDIWLGATESATDRALMAHELAHVTQQNGNVIALRSATWIERRAWLSFFDHYLPRKFLNNYMDDTGAPITLTQTEMIDCNPIVDLKRSKQFLVEVSKLRAAGGGKSTIAVSGWGGALTNGTLGNFTIHYQGELTVTAAGTWTFNGVMDFYDYWDFDPKPFGSGSGRPIPAEIKVRVAHYGLPGKPFDINSVKVPVQQTDADTIATWVGGVPSPVPDKGGRTVADIAVGGAVGASGGIIGDVGGSEAGAQSAEDLNKKKKP